MTNIFTIPSARIHYPDIFEPVRRFAGDPPEGVYRCHILVAKSDTKLLKAIKAAHDAAMPAGARSYRPFDIETKTELRTISHFPTDGAMAKDPALEGYWRITATQYADRPVRVLDEDGQPAGPDVIYPGCVCRFAGEWRAYSNTQKGVRFLLHGVRKIADGERFRMSSVSDQAVLSALGIDDDDEIPF